MAKVLVVEDHPDVREAVTRLLKRAGHEVRTAENGELALEAMSVEKPDLIVLDIRLPAMDGVSFLQVMKSYLKWSDVPVVVVTAISDLGELDYIRQVGATHIFQKPAFDPADLVACIGELLEKRPPKEPEGAADS
jgi:DNA-binding response OmpR family regulator